MVFNPSAGTDEALSPAGNQFDLVMRYKVFFFTDSCWLGIVFKESN